MNAYGMDFTLLDFGLPDHLLYEGLTHDFAASSSPVPVQVDPTFRHDGTSPLPLGMEWSPPPQKWVCFIFLHFSFFLLLRNFRNFPFFFV